MNVTQKCNECQALFNAKSSEIQRGNAKYCSRVCGYIGSRRTRLAQIKKIPNVECAFCHQLFYKAPSKCRSKSGLFFCCRAHKDLAQRLEAGLKEIQPPHYGTSLRSYREKALLAYGAACSRCRFNQHSHILDVHHRDHNRENNALENLEVLCPNCHALEHRSPK